MERVNLDEIRDPNVVERLLVLGLRIKEANSKKRFSTSSKLKAKYNKVYKDYLKKELEIVPDLRTLSLDKRQELISNKVALKSLREKLHALPEEKGSEHYRIERLIKRSKKRIKAIERVAASVPSKKLLQKYEEYKEAPTAEQVIASCRVKIKVFKEQLQRYPQRTEFLGYIQETERKIRVIERKVQTYGELNTPLEKVNTRIRELLYKRRVSVSREEVDDINEQLRLAQQEKRTLYREE